MAEELAAALTLTGRSAAIACWSCARRLERLPQTTALLAAGVIDRSRAAVIADQLSLLDDAAAAAVEDRIARRAGAMTTGRLAAACQRAVLAHDPQAAARRKERAQREARVECWAEPSGTGAIAGRDLNLAGVIAADKHLDAAARWLQQHGASGHHRPATRRGVPGPPRRPAPRHPAPPARRPRRAQPAPDPAPGGPAGTNPGGPGGPDLGALASPGSWPGGLGDLTGTVNLTIPATTWLGLTDTPGGDRRARRDRRRHLPRPSRRARRPRRQPLVPDPDRPPRTRRRARLRPRRTRTTGRSAETGDPIAWLAGITITPIETGACAHRRETTGLPASRLPTPPDQDPQPPVRLPRLPPPRHPLRRRPHHPPPPGRQDVRVQSAPAVPTASPGQAGPRLAPQPARTRPPDLDHPQRPPLHHRP